METEDNRYTKHQPYTPAPPRKPGQISRPHTPGTPQPTDKGVDAVVERVIRDSSGLP